MCLIPGRGGLDKAKIHRSIFAETGHEGNVPWPAIRWSDKALGRVLSAPSLRSSPFLCDARRSAGKPEVADGLDCQSR